MGKPTSKMHRCKYCGDSMLNNRANINHHEQSQRHRRNAERFLRNVAIEKDKTHSKDLDTEKMLAQIEAAALRDHKEKDGGVDLKKKSKDKTSKNNGNKNNKDKQVKMYSKKTNEDKGINSSDNNKNNEYEYTEEEKKAWEDYVQYCQQYYTYMQQTQPQLLNQQQNLKKEDNHDTLDSKKEKE